MKTINVYSSQGELTANAETGEVITSDITLREGNEAITKIDLEEWIKYWNEELPYDDGIDILDIGVWYRDNTGNVKYSPAEEDWRQEIKRVWERD